MVMKLTVKKTGINGEGIAYYDHKPVFIDGALPGETVLAEITEQKATYAKAQLQKILVRSPERVRPVCRYQKECGGCPLMSFSQKAQRETKISLLSEALYKYGNVKSHFIRALHEAPRQTGYRNQFKLPVHSEDGKLVTGMYAAGSNRFVAIDRCEIHDPALEKARTEVLNVLNRHGFPAWDPKTSAGLRYLIMRIMNGKIQCTLVTGRNEIPEELTADLSRIKGMAGIFQSVQTAKKAAEIFGSRPKLLYGENFLEVQTGDVSISLSPQSFFQLNTEQAMELYKTAVSKIDRCDVLAEAYCGVGAMSFLAAEKAKKIIGIENVRDAVDNANETARKYGFDHITFMHADAAEGLRKTAETEKIDCILMDPPRSGLDDEMISAVLEAAPKKIIYISCNPATLGKNLKLLKHNYHVVTVIPFDLFPQTPHIESVTVLERG